MAESTPIIATDTSVGPNDAKFIALADAAQQAAEQAKQPAGEFGFEDAQVPSGDLPSSTDSPAPLAGKFKDAQELEKAYLELQKKLGDKPQEAKAPTEQEVAKAIGQDALSEFVTEFRTNNTLSEDSYGKLQKMGLSKDVVDAYIEGQKALVDRQVDSVYAKVGGRESFQQIIDWATQNLPADEQEAYNSIMSSGDMKAAGFAISTLAARYQASGGRTPNRIEGKPTVGQVGFNSQSEMISMMADPRYKTDASFRQDVARRMAVTKFNDR